MLFFWYCFDDYVATLTANPALGHVPWWAVLVANILLCVVASPFRTQITYKG